MYTLFAYKCLCVPLPFAVFYWAFLFVFFFGHLKRDRKFLLGEFPGEYIHRHQTAQHVQKKVIMGKGKPIFMSKIANFKFCM